MRELTFHPLTNSQVGYASHEMIYSPKGKPIDYRFIEANDAFLKFTGLTADIIGKTATEAILNIKENSTDWIRIYGDVATNESTISFERYSEALADWYTINAFSPKKGFFNVLLTLIPQGNTKILTDTQIEMNYYRNESLVQMIAYQSYDMIDFLDYALSEAIKLTKSAIGYIYLYDEKTEVLTLNSWSKGVMRACTMAEKQTTYLLENTGFWGEVIRQKKAIINNNFKAPHHLKKGFPHGHASLDKFMSLPIYDKGQIIAVIGLGNKIDDYTQNDALLIQSFMEEVWNIAKRKQAEDTLEREQRHLKITLESVGEGIISVDENFVVFSMNKKAESFLGIKENEGINQTISSLLGRLDKRIAKYFDYLINRQDLRTNDNQQWSEVIKIKKSDRKLILSISTSPIFDSSNNNQGFVVVLRDITKEYQDSEQIKFISYHDALTGIYNRRFFEEELLRLDTKSQYPLSIIMGDVNGLKLANDAFGHLEGDKLLKVVSDVLKSCSRKEDILARWGGDEFILLLPQTTTSHCQKVCSTILQKCKEVQDTIVDVSISLGYATKYSQDQEINTILTEAEDIMYRQKLSETKSQRSAIIETIKNTLQERNHETEEHATRLVEYTKMIANALSLSNDDKADLKLLAVLHDIGKIGISDKILLKPTALTEDEWVEMRKHPVIGYRIAQSSPDLQKISSYILYHHERWDGTGYPDGLLSDTIPLLSRIVAVADAFDAMTSDRPYRMALSKEQAIIELKKHAGSQFDPKIIESFLDCIT